MNLFFILFFISIALYLFAAIGSLLSSHPKRKISDFIITVLSVTASAVMLSATVIEAVVFKFAELECTLFGDLLYPVSFTLKMENY